MPRALRRVESLVSDRIGEPLTLAVLAAAAGMSERALQSQFRKYRQCTPMQFVRDSRLAMARAILSGASDIESVGTVAFKCGFNHLARFASDYQRRFGELPSETRQKAHSGERPLLR
jgi:transcriptional regulator GlxA family with amidase domain